jgi:beta-galactosidase
MTRANHALVVLAALSLIAPGRATSAEVAPRPALAPDTILYGAAYYHEYMPYERLEKDIELMKRAGISVVRVGESTWTSWEPREGEFSSPGWTAWWTRCTRPGSRS